MICGWSRDPAAADSGDELSSFKMCFRRSGRCWSILCPLVPLLILKPSFCRSISLHCKYCVQTSAYHYYLPPGVLFLSAALHWRALRSQCICFLWYVKCNLLLVFVCNDKNKHFNLLVGCKKGHVERIQIKLYIGPIFSDGDPDIVTER